MQLSATHVDGLRFVVTAEQHALLVDAPESEGGTGTGMNSRQLFAASEAACILSFVANSLQLRGLPMRKLSLEMDYEQAKRPQRISQLDMRILVDPPVPEEMHRAILAVAERSILPNTLRHPPDVYVSLA